MHSVQQLVAFADTARHGSFAAAARENGSAPSSLAKAVARLEASLGVRLFHRTTRQVSLTPDGERLFERCQRLLAEIDDLRAEAAGVRSSPSGVLRVDLPIVFGRKVVLPVLARLAREHPGLALDVRLQDGYADLVKEGVDVAVRVGALKDSTLVARRFTSQSLLLVGSPAYLRERGTPRRLEQLQQRHQAIVFRMPSTGRPRPWQFRQDGRAVDLHPPTTLRMDDGEAMVQCALLGLGLAQVPHYFVDAQLASGELVEVLPGLRPAPMPISVVYPAARLVPQRVRVLVDALVALRP